MPRKKSKSKPNTSDNKILIGVTIIIIIALVIITMTPNNKSSGKLETTDKIKIAYNYFPSKNNPETNKGIILLHQFGLNKESYKDLIPELKDYHVIALDSRGFGESDLDYTKFKNFDFQTMINDVNTAIVFLNEKNVDKIGIIGASIGANTALNAAKEFRDIKTAILLSPGLEYRGINIEETSKLVKKPILIIVTNGDEYSFISSRILGQNLEDSNLIVLGGNEHGVNLFSESVKKDIVAWLKDNL
ncbi:MAG: alpha/beta hydrolase [Candidatus Nanoarchaeia archaeon]